MNKILELNSGLGYISLNAINNDILKYIKNSIKNSLCDLLAKNNLIPKSFDKDIYYNVKTIKKSGFV